MLLLANEYSFANADEAIDQNITDEGKIQMREPGEQHLWDMIEVWTGNWMVRSPEVHTHCEDSTWGWNKIQFSNTVNCLI